MIPKRANFKMLRGAGMWPISRFWPINFLIYFSSKHPSKISTCWYLFHFIFAGQIPKEIGNSTMIKWQHFGYNNLTGTTIFSITEIRHLYGLIYVLNIILAGVIPREIGNWYFLQQLNLQFNSLTGSIPMEIFNLSKLSAMSLLRKTK